MFLYIIIKLFGGFDKIKILKYFPIDTSSTIKLNMFGLKPSTNVFKVLLNSPLIQFDLKEVKFFIIDTFSGMKIACKPHIVDKQLEELCLDSAREFVKVLEQLDLLS